MARDRSSKGAGGRKANEATRTSDKRAAREERGAGKAAAGRAGKRGPGRPPGSRRSTPPVEAAPPGARVIKRYGNRRLYDARLSRCVTVQEIAEFVRRGEDVRVVEDPSGHDVTRRVLLQIILEEQNQSQLDLVPIELLRQLIAFRGDAQTEWLSRYLSAGSDWLRRQMASAEPAMRAAQNPFFAPWLGMDAFRPPVPGAAPASPPTSAAATNEASSGAAPSSGSGSAEPADLLRQQVEDLQRRMGELTALFRPR